ncbi:MAG: FAD-dependent oxidoreductase [Actinomycetota bacterium]|nr:FAD-dependent oxidoreductase [Actinomycetota bacterium]
MGEFDILFSPVRIGSMELKNRLVMPAMCCRFGTEEGAVSPRLIDYYVERARGGVGLIVIENTCVDWPTGKAGMAPIRIDDFKYIGGLHDLAEAVHPYGVKIATQLHHTGRQNTTICTEGQQLVAPSPVPCMAMGGEMPRELTREEIEAIITKYVLGAARTKMAGFDAVEIHGAHGYLVQQFMSPLTNHREDEFGGDFEGRMRFPLRIIEGIRAGCGPDFPIIFRMSADEYVEGGLILEDAKAIARKLEEAGVDAISVSAGIYDSQPSWFARIFPPAPMPPGCNVHLAEEIKKVVSIPVIVAGKLDNPYLAAEVLEKGKADLVAIGRPLLADPHLPRKVAEGRLEDIRPCLYCNQSCYGNLFKLWSIQCDVNPELGRERELALERTANPRKVMVVGGGPAGMEAARILALRGHSVVLCEKEGELGGQLKAGSTPSFKGQVKRLLNHLSAQLERVGVEVRLNTEVTPELVKKEAPDAVVVATGAVPDRPDIRGIEGANIRYAADVLTGKAEVGDKVVVLGGGDVGLETALHLAETGKTVKVVEKEAQAVPDMNTVNRLYLLWMAENLGVEILTGTEVVEIEPGKVTVSVSGESRELEADVVVVATGYLPHRSLAEKLKRLPVKVYEVGDCREIGRIKGAIHGAAILAREI